MMTNEIENEIFKLKNNRNLNSDEALYDDAQIVILTWLLPLAKQQDALLQEAVELIKEYNIYQGKDFYIINLHEYAKQFLEKLKDLT